MVRPGGAGRGALSPPRLAHGGDARGRTGPVAAQRVRQVVVAVEELEARAAELEDIGLPFVHEDPAVAAFGAVNSLHAAGDTFVELLAERDEGSPVGRHLARLGGDGGYMVIVQVDDLDAHLERVAELGIRVIWSGGVDGIRGAHLHPADVGGAILSLDEADPPEAWPWCGPDWTGAAPPTTGAPITGIGVTAAEPAVTARRWGDVLGREPAGTTLRLPGTTIEFVPADGRPDRLVSVRIPGAGHHRVAGVHLQG